MIKFNKELNLDITKVNHQEGVVDHLDVLDFNRFFFLLDRNEENFFQKREHACKLTSFQVTQEGQQFESAVKNIFDYKGEKMDTYVFSSFCKKGITPNHHDDMTVFLIPTYGDVVYSVYNEKEQHYFLLKKGDLLVIPRNVVHSAIPLNPRIVVSVGVYN